MKKKLLLRWLRCVFSLRLPWRAHNGLRDSAINRFAFFIDAQRVSQTSQPANFIANPTFQNFFRRHSRLSRLFASAPPQKRSGLWPNWVSLAKCLHESIGVDSFLKCLWAEECESICNTFGDAIGTSFKYINQGIDPTPWPFLCVLSIIFSSDSLLRVGSLIYGVCFHFFSLRCAVLAFLFVPSNCTSHKQL